MDSDTTDVIELEDLEEKEETDAIQKSKNRRLQYRSTAVSFAEDVTERRRSSDSVFVTSNSINSDDSGSNREKLTRLKSRLNLQDLSRNELELKASLYFHICNPLKRWKVERLVPYKLVLQIIKTIFLVVQVILFTYTIQNERSVYFYKSQHIFEKLFIKSSQKISGSYNAYIQNEVIEEITFAVNRYYQLPNLTLGGYGYMLDSNGDILPIQVLLRQYKMADLEPSCNTFIFDSTVITTTFQLNSSENISIQEQLEINGLDMSFHRLISLDLALSIRSIHITETIAGSAPECFLFNVKLIYSNHAHNGKLEYFLTNNVKRLSCNGQILSSTKPSIIFTSFLTILDVIVTIMCLVSILFTLHSYHRGYTLGKAMGEFYQCKLRIHLNWWERRHLFSMWHLFTSFSDVFLITGSLLKILLQYNVITDPISVRILLGSTLIIQSGAMLRYFSFFKQLNALTRTLSAASPKLIKFMICTSLLYFAFALCGLVVFEPYGGEMFGNLGNSVEILFSLINGDSIWLVFRAFTSDNLAIYIYSRIFVYSFCFLFIYAVLNLFTSLVKAAYDASIMVDRATINEVHRFVFSGPLTPNGGALRDVTYVEKYVDPAMILSRRSRRRKQSISDLD